MSQPEEEKLKKFTSAVLQDAEEQRQKVLAEIEDYRRGELEKAEEEVLHETYVMIQNEIAHVKNAHSKQVSLAELERRRKLLVLREQITQKVFSEVSGKLTTFAGTDEYIEFVCGLLRESGKEIPDGQTSILVRKEDLKHADAFVAAYGKPAVCEEDSNILIGGAIVFNHDKGVVTDLTLDLRLSSQKDWFTANSGLTLS